jgi:hypothetical protein
MYIGPYRQLSLIKVGHKTQIWEVVRDSTREKFAIKILRQDPPERQQVQLLQHEFRVGSKLEHPHLVRILQFDTHKGMPYLVMELFLTLNLKQRIVQGHERLAHLAERFIDEASEVLQYLHQGGWVHRDIKPDNFLVSPEGEVKLIDLALMQRATRGLSRLFSRRSKTIQGTPSYLAPEQIRCQALDTSADVYSLGCTIFELLTGKTPYTGSTLNELLNKHLRAPRAVAGGSQPERDPGLLATRAADAGQAPAGAPLDDRLPPRVPRRRRVQEPAQGARRIAGRGRRTRRVTRRGPEVVRGRDHADSARRRIAAPRSSVGYPAGVRVVAQDRNADKKIPVPGRLPRSRGRQIAVASSCAPRIMRTGPVACSPARRWRRTLAGPDHAARGVNRPVPWDSSPGQPAAAADLRPMRSIGGRGSRAARNDLMNE